jgi:hypothetical protein
MSHSVLPSWRSVDGLTACLLTPRTPSTQSPAPQPQPLAAMLALRSATSLLVASTSAPSLATEAAAAATLLARRAYHKNVGWLWEDGAGRGQQGRLRALRGGLRGPWRTGRRRAGGGGAHRPWRRAPPAPPLAKRRLPAPPDFAAPPAPR